MDCAVCGGWVCIDPEIVGDDRTCPVCECVILNRILQEAIVIAGLKGGPIRISQPNECGNGRQDVYWRGMTISVTTAEWPVLTVYRQKAPGWLNDVPGGHKVQIAAPDGLEQLATTLKKLTTHE